MDHQDYDFLELSDTDIREIFANHFDKQDSFINKILQILLLYLEHESKNNKTAYILSKRAFNGITNFDVSQLKPNLQGVDLLIEDLEELRYNDETLVIIKFLKSLQDNKVDLLYKVQEKIYTDNNEYVKKRNELIAIIISALIQNGFVRTAKRFYTTIEWTLPRNTTFSLLCKSVKANQYITTRFLYQELGYLTPSERILVFREIKRNAGRLNINILEILPVLATLYEYNALLDKANITNNKSLVLYLLKKYISLIQEEKAPLTDLKNAIELSKRYNVQDKKIIKLYRKMIIKNELVEFITESIIPVSIFFGLTFISVHGLPL